MASGRYGVHVENIAVSSFRFEETGRDRKCNQTAGGDQLTVFFQDDLMQAAVVQVFRKPAAHIVIDICVGMFFFVVKLSQAGAGEQVSIIC